MGWWQIDLTKEEVEAFENSDQLLMNSLPKRDSANRLYSGDQPADIMEETIGAIDRVYKKAWGRNARREELIAALEFVIGERK